MRAKGEGQATALVQDALRRRRVLWIRYAVASRHYEITEREIEPYCLEYRDGGWYVHAFCRLRCEGRTFRLDRVLAMSLVELQYPVKPDIAEALWRKRFTNGGVLPACGNHSLPARPYPAPRARRNLLRINPPAARRNVGISVQLRILPPARPATRVYPGLSGAGDNVIFVRWASSLCDRSQKALCPTG